MTTAGAAQRLRLLCVDDDPDIREIIRLSLSLDPQFETRLVTSAILALREMADGFEPDVLLIDHHLDGITGLDLLRYLQRSNREPMPTVIFLTASARARNTAEFSKAGAAGIITKPFDPLSLAARIRTICEVSI